MSRPKFEDLMETRLCFLNESKTAAEARAMIRPGEVVIVQNDTGEPLGVFSAEDVYLLQDSERLANLTANASFQRINSPDEVLPSAGQKEQPQETPKWYLVYKAGRPVGAVNRATVDQGLKAVKTSTRSIFGTSIAGPASLVYLCESGQRHFVRPEEVQERSADGRPICPLHRTFMTPINFAP